MNSTEKVDRELLSTPHNVRTSGNPQNYQREDLEAAENSKKYFSTEHVMSYKIHWPPATQRSKPWEKKKKKRA